MLRRCVPEYQMPNDHNEEVWADEIGEEENKMPQLVSLSKCETSWGILFSCGVGRLQSAILAITRRAL
jgi:hypothetical protein